MSTDNTLPARGAMASAAAGALMISFSAVWVKLSHVAPTVSAFYRVFFGSIFLLMLLMLRREKVWRGWSCMGLALVAGIFFALDLYAWHRSILYVGPGLATILANFEVFLVPLVGWLLYRERVRPRFVLSVPVAVFGLFMIIGVTGATLSATTRIGIAFGLATAVFYTGYLVALRRVQSHSAGPSPVVSLTVVSIITAAYLAVDVGMTGASFAIPDIQSGLALVALGLGSQTIGWLLIARSLPKIPAAIAGLLLLLQPSLSFVWDVLLFGRATSATAWLGVAVVLVAIYLGATSER